MKILIVDDEEGIRVFLKEYLEGIDPLSKSKEMGVVPDIGDFSAFLETVITVCFADNSLAVSYPMPLLAPVITIFMLIVIRLSLMLLQLFQWPVP